ncbi:MAG TPA: cytochrome c biogenesis heme-transporting ATPase CcmA [Burkholderiales bacterium]|nr:cytochrome c biogenesis heme-transporting ATPase CcmA [Burkholderiales bacterium]
MLEANDLECERGGRTLFSHLSFAVGKGELLRIAGTNGSGKTSLLRILCGLLSPDAGEVRWQGSAILRLREEYSKQLLYLGHAPAVKDDLTPAENLRITCTLAGVAVVEYAIEESLGRFGLSGIDPPVKKLSQGQKRRAALARLLLSESIPLWLLDEPFAALDASATRLVGELIDGHVARGGAVVFTTHQDTGVGASRVIDLDA